MSDPGNNVARTSCALLRNVLFRTVCLFGKNSGVQPLFLLFLSCVHSWTRLRPFLPLSLICHFLFLVSFADGALPSADSSPNAISLDLS